MKFKLTRPEIVNIDESAGVVVAVAKLNGVTMRGIARCNINDDFDEEIGIKIAVARCCAKQCAYYAKRIGEINERLYKAWAETTMDWNRMKERQRICERQAAQYDEEFYTLNDEY